MVRSAQAIHHEDERCGPAAARAFNRDIVSAASPDTSPTHPGAMSLAPDAGAGHALASRSKCHKIRGLAWDDRLLHATAFNRRHPMMEVA